MFTIFFNNVKHFPLTSILSKIQKKKCFPCLCVKIRFLFVVEHNTGDAKFSCLIEEQDSKFLPQFTQGFHVY